MQIRKTIQPSRADVHVNRPLTNISLAYIQSASNFVAASAFPVVPVSKQSDRYFTYDRGYFNRDEMKIRAPGTESAGTNYAIDSSPTYFCDVWSLHANIDDQVAANSDNPLNLERERAEFLTLKGLLRREKEWASTYFAGSIWTNDVDGVASSPGAGQVLQWDNASSTPIEDVRTAKRTVLESTGFEPNKLVLGRAVYDKLVDHPDIVARLDRGQTSGPAKANKASLASLFEVEDILVMNAIENTAKEGAANSHSFIGGKKALLAYAPASPGLMTPSAGYTFSWTGLTGMTEVGSRIFRYRMDNLRSNRVEIEMAFDMKLVAADLGYFWDTIVA